MGGGASVAQDVEIEKVVECSSLADRFVFTPVETSRVVDAHSMAFLWRFGKIPFRLGYEPHRRGWILWHVSLAMVRGGAFSIVAVGRG